MECSFWDLLTGAVPTSHFHKSVFFEKMKLIYILLKVKQHEYERNTYTYYRPHLLLGMTESDHIFKLNN